jgi:chromosome partitioning protein
MAEGKIISFLNMKGGVGKTTLCIEMALFLSEYYHDKKNVLVIDIDPQSNSTHSFYERFEIVDLENPLFDMESLPSINKVFTNSFMRETKIEEAILELTKNLHLLPGDLGTVFMDRETSTGAAEQRLLNFIIDNDLKNKYDYIFIDCPPTYSFYTVSALLSSDFYFVPVKPDAYSILGLDLLERVVADLKRGYRFIFDNKPIKNLGVIFTMVGGSNITGIRRNINYIKEAFKDKGIYFFKNEFRRVDKLATGKLSTFIIDREDASLIEELKNICIEFMERVVQISEESPNLS